MRIYCTLFDKNYMVKGLALHASLVRHASPFKLFILALDDETLQLLNALELPSAVIIPLHAVEHALKLTRVRESRSWMEYCWTLASQFMSFLFLVNSPSSLTYLDADLFFFSSPEPIFEELDWLRAGLEGSIAIIPHRFHAGNKRLEANGIYNVGWLTIRNTTEGQACLLRWAGQCRDWCYHRNENGKFGDQGYLDTWPQDYGDHCRVIQNTGAGLAPWNVMDHHVREIGSDHIQIMKRSAREFDERAVTLVDRAYQLIFYHFHEFTHDALGNHTRLTRHPHTFDHKRLIYGPYIVAIKLAAQQVMEAQHLYRIRQDQIKEQGERA